MLVSAMSFAVLVVLMYIYTRLGLLKCIDQEVSACSDSERKCLSIAIELISRPSLLELDEPTTGMDGVVATKIALMLKKLTV